MEKVGRVLLFCVNVLINLFLIGVFVFCLVWLISGQPPREALINIMTFIEESGHHLFW